MPVGAGDADARSFEVIAGQLDFADNRHAPAAGGLERRQIRRHSGREDNQIRAFEHRRRLAEERNSESGQPAGGLRQLLERLQIGGHGPRPVAVQQFHRGQAGAAHARHEHPRAVEVNSSHRNFSVVSANSAITSPAIQKRIMIFDSGQPSASKW